MFQDDEYPDVEMTPNQLDEEPLLPSAAQPAAERNHQLKTQSQRDEEDEDLMFGDLLPFILQCVSPALSVIIADCQYDRAELLKKILQRNQGNV